ncbi:YadA family autotransporter adhesin, partial [Burkholderia pseudomallei]
TGQDAAASGESSTATGQGSQAAGSNSTANGAGAAATGHQSTALGAGAQAAGSQGVASGWNANASGTQGVAIGGNASAQGNQSIALGANASATGDHSIALGAGSQATGSNSVALGQGSIADRDNSVSVGSDGGERNVTNVANGWHDTDAVNFRQLREVARYAYSGIAAATALAMIPDVDAGKTFSIGVGTGGYLGYQAVAVGASARLGQNLKVRVGAGISAASTTWGAGASYSW